jgi:uncharacterized protein (DUF362 family)
MSKKITRRKFVKSSLAAGGATLISASIISPILNAGSLINMPGIVTMPADNLMGNLRTLITPLGGIEKFIPAGASVGILLNSPWIHPGTYTHPDVAFSILKLCRDAGAGSIVCFKPVREGYWEESKYYAEYRYLTEDVSYGDDRIEVEIANGVELKKADIFKAFMDVDVYISVPVAKHHSGTFFSGNLKGLMGVSSSNTNRHMHSPDGEYTYDKHEYLSQCIADLNLIRQPDLCIVDAIECVLDNGPRGPGDTIQPNKVLAGTDSVALDAYCVDLLGFDTDDVLTIQKAAKHGLGNDNLENITIMNL